MQPRRRRLIAQLAVLVPTLATSAYLGHLNMPIPQRIGISLGVGLMAIAVVSAWMRRSE